MLNGFARELGLLSERLSEVGQALTSDPMLIVEHGVTLQQFDLFVQWSEELSRALAHFADGQSAERSVAGVRLQRVQKRLSSALDSQGDKGS